MPTWEIKLYLDELPRLKAERQLEMIESVGAPNSKDGLRKIVRSLKRIISGGKEEPVDSIEEQKSKLAGRGIGQA